MKIQGESAGHRPVLCFQPIAEQARGFDHRLTPAMTTYWVICLPGFINYTSTEILLALSDIYWWGARYTVSLQYTMKSICSPCVCERISFERDGTFKASLRVFGMKYRHQLVWLFSRSHCSEYRFLSGTMAAKLDFYQRLWPSHISLWMRFILYKAGYAALSW